MFELYFKTIGQSVFYKVDVENKKVWVKSQVTDYEIKKVPWSSLADKGVVWLTPPKNTKTGLNKIPLRLDDLDKKYILRKLHGLTRQDVYKLRVRNQKQSKEELEKINNMTEEELKLTITKHMLDVGYIYGGNK